MIPAEPPVDPNRFDLYLLMGQSNMAGRGELLDGDAAADPRVWVFNAENRWVNKGEPVHFDKPSLVGVGPGMAFAKAMAGADPGKTIGLVPCAVGNTSLNHWARGGDLYEAAVRRGLAAMQSGTMRAILWHQGESDCQNETAAAPYGEKLIRMIGDLRADLRCPRIPFLAGMLGDFILSRTDDRFPCAKTIDAAIRALPAHVPGSLTVSAAGLRSPGDGVHFDNPSAKELGRRFASALIALRQRDN